jgi:hypothetical protein
VASSETTTSTLLYVDLTTTGPAVTVTVGSSGKALVTITTLMSNSNNNAGCIMAFAISGATIALPTDAQALRAVSSGAGSQFQGSATYLVTGLNAGNTTFTAKYKAQANTCTFANRNLIVTPQ